MIRRSIHRLNLILDYYKELNLTGPPLTVATDRDGHSDRYDLWYESNTHPQEERTYGIYTLGTGHPAPWNGANRYRFRFLGTVITPNNYVWHIFAVDPTPQQGRHHFG